MPIDFNKPATTDNYSSAFVPNITDAFKALGAMLDPSYAGTISNAPAGTKRISGGLFQQYNGSSWAALAMGYALKSGDTFTGAVSGTTLGLSGALTAAGATLTGALNGTSAAFSGALSSGAITQSSGYFNIYPHSGSYDDGGYARAFWDGNNGKLIFRRNGGTGTPGAAIDATSFIGALVGNADTATALKTARTINGVSFNGSANITVADATKLPLAGGTMTGVISASYYSIAHNSGNAFRITHDSGFLSGHDTANTIRTGYLQFNTGSNVRLYAESGNQLQFYADAALKLQLSGALADFKCAAQTTPASVSYAASLTINTALSNVFKVGNLTGNVTSLALTNATEGQFVTIRFRQDGTGGRTVAAPSGAKIDGSIQTAANRTSYLNLTYNATDTRWEGNWFQVPA